MAKLIKQLTTRNKTEDFIKAEKVIKKEILKRNILFRTILLLITLASGFIYYEEYTTYYQYFSYIAIISFICLLLSFIFLRNKFQAYQSYHQEELDKKEIAAINRYSDKVENILKSEKFKLINNFYLPCGGEYLQQIDSIIVGPTNIYVIRLLNYSGIIEGTVSGEKWRSKDGQEVVNHYQQNNAHISAIEDIVYSVVANEEIGVENLVINLETNFNFNMPDKASHSIFDNLYDALYWIKNNERKTEFEIALTEQEEICKEMMKVHLKALQEAEYNINREILEKYNLAEEFLS